jgi:DMSO/TMAO reductase YedYZ molybdopterin-dependent catalytic subunit
LTAFLDAKKMKKSSRNPGVCRQDSLTRFPVLHYGPVPSFNPATWGFRVWGEVENPLDLTWYDFSQLPRTQVTLDIHCVTRWSKFDTVWEGVSLRTLVNRA